MEWNEVWLFIQKWWLEFLLAGIGTGLGLLTRHYFKLAKVNKKVEDQEKKEAFKKELTSEVKKLIKEVKQ